MSSPITIPRATESTAHSSAASSTSSSQLYVPIHKRSTTSASPTSARVPSPTRSDSPSWRSASPTKASSSSKGRKFPANAFRSHHKDTSSRVHIPTASLIPKPSNVPFVYSIEELLALSTSPVTLTPLQYESVQEVITFIALPLNNDKAATRRRRAGRRTNKAVQQKVATQTVGVDVRRTRQGHGTWGWHAYPTAMGVKEHQYTLEESWRHVAIAA